MGSVAFFKRKEIKDILSYLKFCANPDDDLSFERVVNVPARGIGATTIKRLREWAGLNNANMLEAISRVQEIKEIKGKSSKAVKCFQDIISELHTIQTYPVMGFVKAVIEKIGYADYLVLSYEGDSEERLENIEELVNAASEYDASNPDGSLQGFLEEVSLIADIDKWDDAADTVTLMTLHAAKGLEFPVVFMAGLEEGLLPHSQSKDSDDDVEEERRLCYVGITRAQKDLFMIHTRYRSKFGQRSACVPSRFLSEIPVDFVEEIDKTIYNSYADKLRTEPVTGYRDSADEDDYQYDAGGDDYDELPVFQIDEPQESIKLVSGDIVKHEIFGRGRVVKIAPSSDTVHVDFNRVGMKKLALEYANLEKVEGSCR